MRKLVEEKQDGNVDRAKREPKSSVLYHVLLNLPCFPEALGWMWNEGKTGRTVDWKAHCTCSARTLLSSWFDAFWLHVRFHLKKSSRSRTATTKILMSHLISNLWEFKSSLAKKCDCNLIKKAAVRRNLCYY